MTLEEFKKFLLLKDIYLKNSSTKSNDEGVLEIYFYILKYENTDSDWWNEGHDSSDIISIIKFYGNGIWAKLNNDILNWSGFQIELFAQSLLISYPQYPEKELVQERIDFYNYLLTIKPIQNCDLIGIFDSWLHLDLSLANLETLQKLALLVKLETYMNVEDYEDFNSFKRLYLAIQSKK
ncbi:hypothetical protein LNP04_19215 [Chryseobacterium sp. C-71]|uniref:hypothetical protein n=1 Tax=Chryseobacterium sp. C-71 TaxID=2893882 RepID=UPI001E3CFBB2|nr:hypothetical protein [Chryseobacterium sp. C-71]UFH32072.1 hypothetical protein LNP04_19215 [Chryseobacterium sp. C-71]